jgi:hypothetical protein
MPYTPNDIVLEAFSMEDFTFTYFITGHPDPEGIVGKAVAIDTAQRGSVRLADEGDAVYGRIYQYEDRTQQGGGKVVSVERKFRKRLPKETATAIEIGDTVEGAGDGLVAAGTENHLDNVVIDVAADGSYVVVEKF